MTRVERRQRRTAAALAGSTLVHIAVLGLLARYSPVLHPLRAATRDFQIELVTAPPAVFGSTRHAASSVETAPVITPRTPKQPSRRSDLVTTTPYPTAARGAPHRANQSPSPPAPSPQPPPAPQFLTGGGRLGPTAGVALGGAGGQQLGPNEFQSDGDVDGARVRGALRTSVGCDDPDYFNLSKAERAVCFRGMGVQAAIGSKQYVDPIASAKVRNAYDHAREACERLNHYATPLDSDRDHSASAPGKWGLDKLHC